MNPPDTIEGQAEARVVQAAASAKRVNYFARHWRGELSLGISYWVNGVLVTWFLMQLRTMVSSAETLGVIPVTLVAGLSLFVFALTIVVSVWLLVGIWRSASNHKSYWATLAKVVVVIRALLVCVVVETYIPQGADMVSILAGDTRLPSYSIRLLPGGTEIVFDGGLRAGCAKELERILSTAPQVRVLDIESPGGRVNEARRMGQLVRKRWLITYTSGYCLSAATLVLMSGTERVVAPGANVGFHVFTLPGATASQQRVIDSLSRAIMRSAGASDEFIKRVLATPSNQMWYPTFEEMREAGVLSSRSYILNGKLEDKPDYIKRLEEWGVNRPLPPDHGDLGEAVELYRKAADQGDAFAQANLGWLYESGQGVPKDLNKAAELFQKAADQGNALGQANLGWLYESGQGVPKDLNKAAELFQKAADQGNALGQANLGWAYETGQGVPKDLDKAAELLQKAADQGNASGQNNLGWLYQNGQGVPKDLSKAAELFQKAADQGNALGQNNLGRLYQNGQGVPKDLTKAVELYQKAADQGNRFAQNNLGQLYRNGQGVPKDLRKAAELFQKTADQGDAFAQVNLGVLYRELGDYDEAIKLYNKAIQLTPNYAPAYYDRALAYSYKHDYAQAIRDSDEAIRRDPIYAAAFANRGADYETTGNLDKAIADYNEAIKLKPTLVFAYYRRAHTYERLKKFDKAISDYDQVIRINPQDAHSYAIRGNANFKKGNYKEALSDLTKAVDSTPSDGYALGGLAWFEATCPEDSLRNGKDALQRSLKACELTKWEETGPIETLAAAYAELGDFSQAIKYQLLAKNMTRGNVFERKEMEERLALYNEHKPYRDESKLTRR